MCSGEFEAQKVQLCPQSHQNRANKASNGKGPDSSASPLVFPLLKKKKDEKSQDGLFNFNTRGFNYRLY